MQYEEISRNFRISTKGLTPKRTFPANDLKYFKKASERMTTHEKCKRTA
jgi:hypothetical protein